MICATIINKGNLGGGGGGPSAPVASFNTGDTDPTWGETVQFTDTSSGAPTSWQWFINGVLFSAMQNPTFYFGAVGTYQVTLTVANAFGSNTTNPGTQVRVHGGIPP